MGFSLDKALSPGDAVGSCQGRHPQDQEGLALRSCGPPSPEPPEHQAPAGSEPHCGLGSVCTCPGPPSSKGGGGSWSTPWPQSVLGSGAAPAPILPSQRIAHFRVQSPGPGEALLPPGILRDPHIRRASPWDRRELSEKLKEMPGPHPSPPYCREPPAGLQSGAGGGGDGEHLHHYSERGESRMGEDREAARAPMWG